MVRQYTQLISLMENWDTFQTNLATAEGSTGSLQEQADIYAESWEAARDRVTASAEAIYSSLIDEDFFIGVDDTISKVLDGISSLINSLGGLKGVLAAAGLIATSVFKDQMAAGINSALNNFRTFSGVTQRELQEVKDEAYSLAMVMTKDIADSTQVKGLRQQLESVYTLQKHLDAATKSMTKEQRAAAEEAMKIANNYAEAAVQAAKMAQSTEQAYVASAQQASQKYGVQAQHNLTEQSDSIISYDKTDVIKTANALIQDASGILEENNEKVNTAKEAQRLYLDTLRDTNSTQQDIIAATVILQDALQDLAVATKGPTEEFGKFQRRLSDAAEKVVQTSSAIKKLQASIGDKTETTENQAKAIAKLANEMNEAGLSTDDFTTALNNYETILQDSSSTPEQLAEAENKLIEAFQKVPTSAEAQNNAIKTLAGGTEIASSKIGELIDKARQNAQAQELSGDASERAGDQAKEAAAKISGQTLVYQSIGSAAMGAVQSISSFGMGLNALSSIKDTFTNDDLSTWEKTTQIMMSLGMTIPMLTTGFTNLGNVYKFVTSTSEEGLVAKIADLLLTDKEVQSTKELIDVKTGDVLATGAQITAEKQAELAEAGMTTAIKVNTATVWKNIKAQITWKTAMGGIVAILVAGGLIVAIYALTKACNADADAAKKAAETASDLSDAYDDAKSAAESLSSAFDDYTSVVETLNACTKGTQEWKEALQDVNSEVLALIQEYPELAKYVYRNEDGALTIDQSDIDAAIENAEKAASVAEYASLMGNANADVADVKSDTTNLQRSLSTAIGTNSLPSGWSKEYISSIVASNASQLTGLTDEEFSKAIKDMFPDYSGDMDQLVNSILAYKDDIDTLGAATQDTSDALSNTAQIIAAAELGDEYDATTTAIAGQKYQANYSDIEAQILNEGTHGVSASAEADNENVKDIWERYKSAANIEYNLDTSNAITGTDSNRKFNYIDEEGERQSVTLESIAATIAAAEALESLSGDAEAASKALSTLDKNAGEGISEGIKNWITSGNLEDMTQDDFDTMQADMTKAGGAEQYLEKLFDTDEEGLTSLLGEDYLDKFTWAQKDYGTALDDFTSGMLNSVQNIFKDSSNPFKGLTITGQKAIASLLEDALVYSGQEGFDALEDYLSNLSDEEKEAFADIDWSTANLNDLQDVLKDAGIETDITSEALQGLKDALQSAQQATTDLTTAQENYANIYDIAGSLSQGSTLDADKYAELGDWASAYFEKMSDGTYKLVGSAEAFQNALNVQATQEFVDGFKNAKEELQQSLELNNYSSPIVSSLADQNAYDHTSTGVVAKKPSGGDIYGDVVNQAGTDIFTEQLNFLEAANGMSQEAIAKYREMAEEGSITEDAANAVQEAVQNSVETWENSSDAVSENYQALQEWATQAATAATTTEQLESVMLRLSEAGISDANYNEALAAGLLNLAAQYDNTTQEVNAYYAAIATGKDSTKALNELAIAVKSAEQAAANGLEADDVEELARAFQKMGKAGQEGYESLADDAEAATDAAVRYKRLNNAVEDLADNYDDYADALKDIRKASTSSDKALAAQTSTAKSLKTSLAGLLDTSEDLIDADFMSSIDPDDLQAAADGDEAAIQRIRDSFIDAQADLYGLGDKADDFKAQMAGLADGATIDVNDDSFITKLIEAAALSGQSADKIQSMLSGFDIDCDVTPMENALDEAVGATATASDEIVANMAIDSEAVSQTSESNDTKEAVAYDTEITATNHPNIDNVLSNEGNELTPKQIRTNVWSYSQAVTPKTETEEETKQTTTTAYKFSNFHKSAGGNVSSKNKGKVSTGSSSGSSGSSGSSSKAASRQAKTKVGDRYKEVTDSLDNVTRAYTKLSTAMDNAYGKDRLKNIQKINDNLKQQVSLLQQQTKEAQNYLKVDKQWADESASYLGKTLQYNSAGDITNYTALMKEYQALQNQMTAELNAASTEDEQSEITEKYQDRLDAWEDLIDKIGQYDETKELIQDLQEQIDDAVQEIKDNNYQILTYKLELKVTVNDNDLKALEYYFSQVEDDIYKAVEGFGYLTNEVALYTRSSGYLDQYKAAIADLNAEYAAGNITQTSWIEGLQDAYDGIIDNLSALQDLDDTMVEYYGDTYDLALEKIQKYTDRMDNQISVLEHYSSIMSLLGKEQDYNLMDVILKGQATVAQNSYKVSQAQVAMAKEQVDNLAKLIAETTDAAALEMYQTQYEKAIEEYENALDQMLSDAETWGEALQAILTNAMSQAASEMEKAMTGGLGWDAISDSMDRVSTRQDEYLTKTNQIYETNKLLRSISQDIDKTDNKAAKQRYSALAKEIEQLQEKDELSNLELEIAQAKYKQLQAQIALEEAQNAKSTVRLTRDSEGNYGYVYTADQDAIDDAQQALEDAENDLYNLRLENANNYAEKAAQTQQELYDTLTQMYEDYQNGAYESEEAFEEAKAKVIEEYTQLIETYQDLYGIATQEDARVVEDAWTTAYQNIVLSGNSSMSQSQEDALNWKDALTAYLNEVDSAIATWQQQTSELTDLVGTDLDETQQKVDEVVNANEELKDTLVDDIIPAMGDILTATQKATQGYANQRAEIEKLIEAYKKLAAQTNSQIKGETGVDTSGSSTAPSTGSDSGASGSGSGSSNSGSGSSSSSASGSGNGTLEVGDTVTYTGKYYYTSSGKNPTGSKYSGVENGVIVDKLNNNSYGVHIKSSDGKYGDLGWVKKDQVSGYDTGGYTGSWGEEGKLAFLHQKELVLNSEDTTNLLETVDMVRKIASMIDLNAMYANQVNMISAATASSSNGQLEQTVTITAEFPNATDRNEIEEAFNTLINKASQYANKN